jgi:hypothetical protein
MKQLEKDVDRIEDLADNIEHRLNTCISLSGGDVYLEGDIKKVLHDFSYYRNEVVRLITESFGEDRERSTARTEAHASGAMVEATCALCGNRILSHHPRWIATVDRVCLNCIGGLVDDALMARTAAGDLR